LNSMPGKSAPGLKNRGSIRKVVVDLRHFEGTVSGVEQGAPDEDAETGDGGQHEIVLTRAVGYGGAKCWG
jgi:hypothetical protein